MIEVEQKFRVDDVESLVRRLDELGASEDRCEQHRDTYFNHPCRDFAETREALRVRRIDGVPLVTYKGGHLPGAIKARKELEWRLDPGDDQGTNMEELLTLLSFRPVATVVKRRQSFRMPSPWSEISVVVDRVESLGDFAEIEQIVRDSGDVESARDRIVQMSERLGLQRAESRSYLAMYLERPSS